MRALSNKMNNDRADGHCYSFTCIIRSWTLGDFFFDGSFSLSIVLFSGKMKKIYRLEVCRDFLQNVPSNFAIFSSSFFCAAVSNAS